MGMKPRKAGESSAADAARPVGDTVTQAKAVDEFGNIPGTVTRLEKKSPTDEVKNVITCSYPT